MQLCSEKFKDAGNVVGGEAIKSGFLIEAYGGFILLSHARWEPEWKDKDIICVYHEHNVPCSLKVKAGAGAQSETP